MFFSSFSSFFFPFFHSLKTKRNVCLLSLVFPLFLTPFFHLPKRKRIDREKERETHFPHPHHQALIISPLIASPGRQLPSVQHQTPPLPSLEGELLYVLWGRRRGGRRGWYLHSTGQKTLQKVRMVKNLQFIGLSQY